MKKLIRADGFLSRDPFITQYGGKYYRLYSRNAEALYMACADTIDALASAEGVLVYTPEPGMAYSNHLWAGEMHFIDGRCYIYLAADDGDANNHRMFVLENGTDDPMQPFRMAGKIADGTDKYAIDGTVLHHEGKLYFVWSGREGDVSGCQKLYIARMGDPYTIVSPRVEISTPEYEWEKKGGTGKPGKSFVNEGPFAFAYEGKQYLAYSAAGSWCEHYCIALLELAGEDPMDPKSWKKHPQPVFAGNELVKGGGHCSMICQKDAVHVFFHGWDRNETDIRWEKVALWYGHLKKRDGKFVIE